MSSDATITISRENAVLHSISLVMPVWIKNDGILTIDLPFFKTKTYAKSEADVDKAIEEAVKSFCIASERFGKGVDWELAALKSVVCFSNLKYKTATSFMWNKVVQIRGQLVKIKS